MRDLPLSVFQDEAFCAAAAAAPRHSSRSRSDARTEEIRPLLIIASGRELSPQRNRRAPGAALDRQCRSPQEASGEGAAAMGSFYVSPGDGDDELESRGSSGELRRRRGEETMQQGCCWEGGGYRTRREH